MTGYRVWMLFRHNDQAIWFPVSVAFSSRKIAADWAWGLNTDEYKIEEEDDD